MKNKKTISITAFFLSLSLILLLEASSLGLLAEDIKISQKEEVKIELLLSAANNSSGGSDQLEEREKVEQFKGEKNDDQLESEAEKNVEADKNSLEEKEETKKQNNKIIEEENKSAAKKQEEKEQLQANKIEEQSAEKVDEAPAWMKKLNSQAEADSSDKVVKDDKSENKRDEFNLEKYLAELEKENENTNSNSDQDKQSSDLNSSSEIKNNSLKEAVEQSKSESKNLVTVQNSENNKVDAGGEAQKDKRVYDLRTDNSEQIEKPAIKNYSQPEYPANLRKRNIEGEVIVSLRIDEKGNVHDLKITKSSGFSSFDQAALKAVLEWEFKPSLKGQQKVPVIVNLPIRFKLN